MKLMRKIGGNVPIKTFKMKGEANFKAWNDSLIGLRIKFSHLANVENLPLNMSIERTIPGIDCDKAKPKPAQENGTLIPNNKIGEKNPQFKNKAVICMKPTNIDLPSDCKIPQDNWKKPMNGMHINIGRT